jgi:hypothetical protein
MEKSAEMREKKRDRAAPLRIRVRKKLEVKEIGEELLLTVKS